MTNTLLIATGTLIGSLELIRKQTQNCPFPVNVMDLGLISRILDDGSNDRS